MQRTQRPGSEGHTHHQRGQYGESAGEVFPGDGQLGLDAGEVEQDDEDGDTEAEAPCEHAPGPEGFRLVAH